jgi:lipase chaperone LimK
VTRCDPPRRGIAPPDRRASTGLAGLVVCALIAGAVASRHACARPVPGTPIAVGRATALGVPAPVRATTIAATDPDPSGDPGAAPGRLPASLEGTEPDGAVQADASGHLIVDLELRRLFDHFLVASGEEPIAAMRARIIAVLRDRLPAAAAAEAIAILDRYLAYRDAARSLAPASDPAAGLDQAHELRTRMFSPAVVQAFFAEEEAATYAALARRAVLQDGTLTAAERDRRLSELEAQTPAAVREARAAAIAPLDEMAREARMRAAGASAQQIAAARTAALGSDAEARLAELDEARAVWDSRLAQFRAERAALIADAALDEAERRRRIDELLARSFSPTERIRVEALDRIDRHR